MKLCRYSAGNEARAAFYLDTHLLPLADAVRIYRDHSHKTVELPPGHDLVPLLPGGPAHAAARQLHDWFAGNRGAADQVALPAAKTTLLTPIPNPPKLILLAGNYNEHIQEGGGQATERAKTFPYLFMKPPTTALNHPGAPVMIPAVSPNSIDWELELGVVIGRRCKGVKEADALKHVAGYTVVNDISDRKFRPNPDREERPNNKFFDWQHGKWHDGFCPVGPCVTTADAIPNPQKLKLLLKINGAIKQNATTAQMIFPVAAIIAFISAFVTLEPGDIIATGTPAGVGNTTGTYLKPGDVMEAEIEGIGVLRNPVA